MKNSHSKKLVSLFVAPIIFSSLLLSTAAMAETPVPPGIESVAINGTVQVGQTLTAVPTGVTGYPLNPIDYVWRVRDDSCGWQNGVEYDRGFGSTYTVESGFEGWDLYVVAVVSTGSNEGVPPDYFPDYLEQSVGSASQLINTIAPTIGSATISGTAKVGETLTATANSVTGSPTPTASYQWKADGADVGTNSNTYTPLVGDVGKAITVVITESDGFVPTQLATCVIAPQPSASATSDPTSIVLAADAAPTIGSATISGIAKVGETLTATANTVTGSPTPTASYQWKADGVDVGTNSNTYTPLVGDIGKAITVVITESNGVLPNASATSDPTSNVLAVSQAILKIYNESEDVKASSTIRLKTRGGSGAGEVTYAISGGTAGAAGANCVINGSNLSTTQSGTCIVVATKAANGMYSATTSAAVAFRFKAIAQSSLVLIPSSMTGRKGTSIALGVSGGSGAGLYSFTSSTEGCTVATTDPVAGSGTITRATSTGKCSVKVTRAANGIYSAITSPSVSVTFRAGNHKGDDDRS
jgi:hypothetical protein